MSTFFRIKKRLLYYSLLVIAAAWVVGCQSDEETVPRDEAYAKYLREHPEITPGKDAIKGAIKEYNLFPEHNSNYFEGMDIGYEPSAKGDHARAKDGKKLVYSAAEWKGRNTWMMWTGGNYTFWDYLARDSNGLVDLLRLVDARHVSRRDRFRLMGLVPEPGMKESDGSNTQYGLWIDVPKTANDGDTPRKSQPDPKVYGYSSGILGLRLFPNHAFVKGDPAYDEKIVKKWDAKRYLYDEKYYKDPELVRPFRVGMACAFCHVSYNPLCPPKDPNDPEWGNLAANVGNQYFRIGRIFGYDMREDSLIYQLLNSARHGTLDTSLIATDGNNNPNTMNAVYGILPRIVASLKAETAFETVSEHTHKYIGTLDGLVFNPDVAKRLFPAKQDAKQDDPGTIAWMKKRGFLEHVKKDGKDIFTLRLPNGRKRRVPHVLAVGEDSVGTLAALCRVYLNIGEYHQQWLRTHNVMFGLDAQKPFRIKTAKENSVYWNATEQRALNLAQYFLMSSAPKRLEDADGVKKVLEKLKTKTKNDKDKEKKEENVIAYRIGGKTVIDIALAKNGATVFARACFVCHSSKQPPEFEERFWKAPTDYQRWVKDEKYIEAAKETVKLKDFRDNNYFSTDQQYPISLIGTHAGRALADNALAGRVWEDFASDDYRELGTLYGVKGVIVDHPYENRQYEWRIPRKRRDSDDKEDTSTELYGPGYYRPHTLISIWSTAPFLHNNSVGEYPEGANPRAGQQADVSVLGRLDVFKDSIEKLLWPEKRAGRASIYRTTSDSSLQVPFLLLRSVVKKITGYEPVLLFHRNVWVFPVFVSLFGIAIFLWGRERPRVALKLAGITFLGVALLLWWEAKWQSSYPHVSSNDYGLSVWAAWLRGLVPLLLGLGLLFLKIEQKWAAKIVFGIAFFAVVSIVWWESQIQTNYSSDYQTTWSVWVRVLLFALLGIGLFFASRRLELAMKIAGTIVILFGLSLFSGPALFSGGWFVALLVIFLGFGIFKGVTDLPMALKFVGTGALLIGVVFAWKSYSMMFPLYPVTAVAILVGLILLGVILVWASKHSMLALRIAGRLIVLIAVASFFLGQHLRRNGLTVGYIPKGTPINLVVNINGPGLYEDPDRLKTTVEVIADLLKVQKLKLKTLNHPAVPNLVPNLLKINKCPDFVLDHGHTFGSELSDNDKKALIEYLKTL